MSERSRKGARDERATLPQVPRAKQATTAPTRRLPAAPDATQPPAKSASRRRKGARAVVEEIQAPATGRDRRRE